jgi:hypothetical protein
MMAKYALVEKTNLLLAHNRKPEALQTVQRINAMPGADPLISKKAQALEKEARKR